MVRLWSPFSSCGQLQLLKALRNLVRVHVAASDRAARRAQEVRPTPRHTSVLLGLPGRALGSSLREALPFVVRSDSQVEVVEVQSRLGHRGLLLSRRSWLEYVRLITS